ncbi:hypothetical protein PQX77_008147 [Marasmius sp. AFHP31]|nr:hypothetical protein PQX77_008147 [Marasmius sp. AFHP31]
MRCSLFTLFAVAALASTVAASPLQRRKNVDRPNPPGLEHCPGREAGDADKCTFESQETGPDTTIIELVGDPASNCQGGTTDLQLTLSGSKSVSQSFKAGVTTGFGASLVAKITAKTFLGRVRVNYGDPTGEPGKNDYHFIYFNNGIGSIQPTDKVVWDQKIVNCDEDL